MRYSLHTWEFIEPGQGDVYRRLGSIFNYEFLLTGDGPVSATIAIKVRNIPGGPWRDYADAPLTLTGNDSVSDTLTGDVPWAEHMVQCIALSGINARLRAGSVSG